MVERYLSEIDLPKGARAIEVGCGTGAVTRRIAELLDVSEVVGVDPSPVFLEKARELGKHMSRISFRQGDGQALEFQDESFDLVVFHTTLCHIPDAPKALREAYRLLRPNGWLAAFDGDYMTTTVATGDFDPLQPAVAAMIANFVHDRWLTRRLPRLLGTEGFVVKSTRSHGYTQTTEPTYMMTIVDRGADLLAAAGSIGGEQAEALKNEARRRVKAGEFFGHISFVSTIARKPA
jgi:ubiquinone/menaquinone biosynthesis C-methylase UbiE